MAAVSCFVTYRLNCKPHQESLYEIRMGKETGKRDTGVCYKQGRKQIKACFCTWPWALPGSLLPPALCSLLLRQLPSWPWFFTWHRDWTFLPEGPESLVVLPLEGWSSLLTFPMGHRSKRCPRGPHSALPAVLSGSSQPACSVRCTAALFS